MIERNKALAEANLLRNPDLAEIKEKLQELSEEGKQLCSSIQEMLAEISNNLLPLPNIKHFVIHSQYL